MSAYLKFFELEQSPFEGKGQAQVVLGTRALRDAFTTIQTGLDEGASRICVNGARGLGKTSLARALPKLLGESARVALILDPTPSWEASRGTVAEQWGLESGGLARARLIEAACERKLVLVIDQAEEASEEFLDHLDVLLSYRSEHDTPVVQSVLLARLTTREGRAPSPLVWWLDRIQTLQLEFAPLPRDGIEVYIHKHLKRAGWRGDRLFSDEAARAIHGYSGGVPGEVSSLCERLLSEAAAQRLVAIDADFVHSSCDVEVDGEPEENDEDEEAWTLEDEFEDLALEGEFAHADAGEETFAEAEAALDAAIAADAPDEFDAVYCGAPEADPEVELEGEAVVMPEADTNTPSEAPIVPSLAEALDHFRETESGPVPDEDDTEPVESFETDEVSTESGPEIDAAARLEEAWAEEDPLDAPPTEEELRAIRGSGLKRMLRPFAVAAVAAILGGTGLALLSDEPEPAKSDLSDSLSRTTPKPDRIRLRDAEWGSTPATRTKPADDARPLVLIQPGGKFVPIEALDKIAVPKAEEVEEVAEAENVPSVPSPAKIEPEAVPLVEDPDLEPFATQPAAPAAVGDELAEDTIAEERFW